MSLQVSLAICGIINIEPRLKSHNFIMKFNRTIMRHVYQTINIAE